MVPKRLLPDLVGSLSLCTRGNLLHFTRFKLLSYRSGLNFSQSASFFLKMTNAEESNVDSLLNKVDQLVLGEDGKPLSKSALKKLQKEREKEAKKKAVAERLAAEAAKRDAASVDDAKDNYGVLPLNRSQDCLGLKYSAIDDSFDSLINESVVVLARVQNSRMAGNKMCFFELRQQFSTVQGVLTLKENQVSKQMVKWAAGVAVESLVRVHATVVAPDEPVRSCTVQNAELHINKLYLVSETVEPLPFTMEDATRTEEEISRFEKEGIQYSRVLLDTRLNNRVFDLRGITNQAIFRLQHGVSKLFREFLEQRGFMEIHSPKIIGAASEGGANVFRVSYFKTDAFLAQSPQFYKQMCICSDFDRVYEIGPVFRAENSFTHRHMTEFIGLDLEMAFKEHYHEVVDTLCEVLVYIFTELKKRYGRELAVVNRQYPAEEFLFLPKTLRLTFKEGIELLRGSGVEIGDYDDLSTENERKLGAIVREKYKTDFYVLDRFPLAIRPFYTMPAADDANYSNSYDFFMRGEEILSGAQRVHDPKLLVERATAHGVDPATIKPYVDAFKFGAPPHGGGGIGLERVVMLFLNLGNIRRTSLFPRDPKRLEP